MTLPNDRQVAAWLADDAHEAPPNSLARALAATRRTRKRPRWTFPERWIPVQPTAFAKLGLTAVVIAAVGLVGLTFLPQPSVGPAASASPVPSSPPSAPSLPPLTERFDSTLNAISMSYPAGWQTKPATEPWARTPLAFDSPEVDVIFDPALGNDVYFALVSEPLDGRSPRDWCCSTPIEALDLCKLNGDGPGGGHGAGAYTIDGAEVGWRVTAGCGSGGILSLSVATATRGYIIVLYLGNAPPAGDLHGRLVRCRASDGRPATGGRAMKAWRIPLSCLVCVAVMLQAAVARLPRESRLHRSRLRRARLLRRRRRHGRRRRRRARPQPSRPRRSPPSPKARSPPTSRRRSRRSWTTWPATPGCRRR